MIFYEARQNSETLQIKIKKHDIKKKYNDRCFANKL